MVNSMMLRNSMHIFEKAYNSQLIPKGMYFIIILGHILKIQKMSHVGDTPFRLQKK